LTRITFSGTNKDGFYSSGLNIMGLSLSGTELIQFRAGSVLVGTTDLTTQLILPISNDAVTPTLAFGDSDSGFYESADDVIQIIGIAITADVILFLPQLVQIEHV